MHLCQFNTPIFTTDGDDNDSSRSSDDQSDKEEKEDTPEDHVDDDHQKIVVRSGQDGNEVSNLPKNDLPPITTPLNPSRTHPQSPKPPNLLGSLGDRVPNEVSASPGSKFIDYMIIINILLIVIRCMHDEKLLL